jgi:Amt family ammonium transporter
MVGLFATEGGLFYGDGISQLVTQFIGVITVFIFVTITSGLLFYGIKATVGLRVPPEEELEGLDVVEHGAPGYGPDISAAASVAG